LWRKKYGNLKRESKIKTANKDCEEEKIEEVKDLLENYKGESAVYVFDEKTGKKYIMDRKLWVDVCDNFVSDLKSVIDSSCIVIK
jgi:hypothetical protein